MSRPTDNPKTEVIKVRVNVEQAEWLKASGNTSKAVRDLIDRYVPQNKGIEKHGVIPEKNENEKEKIVPQGYVPQSEYDAVVDELRAERVGKSPFDEDYESLAKLKSYAPLFGLKEEEYIGKIVEAIDGGVLMYENEHFVGVGNLDTSEFEDKCRLNGENAQKALDKIARGM